jgi:hypothetical protein
MKIGDLGTPRKRKQVKEGQIWNGVKDVVGGAVKNVAKGLDTATMGAASGIGNWAVRNGALGAKAGMQATQAYNQQAGNEAYQQKWVGQLKMAFDQAVESGIIDLKASGQSNTPAPTQQTQQPQQSQQQQTQQGFTQGNYKQNPATVKQAPTTVNPKTSIQSTPQQAKPQAQSQGQAVDLDQLKAQSQAKQAQGVAGQQQAMQQMAQTKQANAATSQADNELVARVNAEKAKPGFQQDKGLLSRAAQKGIHESMLEDYVMFNTLVENIVEYAETPGQQSAGGMSAGQWLDNYIQQAAKSQKVDLAQFKAPLGKLVQDFQTKATSGKFPDDIGKKLYSFWASAAASSPKRGDYEYNYGGPSTSSTGTQETDPVKIASQGAKNLASKDPNAVAAALNDILAASGVQPQQLFQALANIQKQAQQGTSGAPGTPPAQ